MGNCCSAKQSVTSNQLRGKTPNTIVKSRHVESPELKQKEDRLERNLQGSLATNEQVRTGSDQKKDRVGQPEILDVKKFELKVDEKQLSARKSSKKSVAKKKKETKPVFIDLKLPPAPQKQIYKFTNDFPVQRPLSSMADWQTVLSAHSKSVQQFEPTSLPIAPDEDKLRRDILELDNRNWIQELIHIHSENKAVLPGSFESIIKNKKALNIREHFTWFVWAVAQHYFGSSTRTESIKLGELSSAGVARKQAAKTRKLPKTNTSKWSEGFVFKGVFFKLIPYEDAAHIRQEIKALKYAQAELLEMAVLDQQTQDQGFESKSPFKDIVVPLLVGVQCGGFYVYGSPLFYTEESVVELKNDFFIPKMCSASMSAGKVVSTQAVEVQNDELIRSMPILKSVNAKNLLSVQDFEDQKTSLGRKSELKTTVNYFLIHMDTVLCTLRPDTYQALFSIPTGLNQEIYFHKVPKDNKLEVTSLFQLLFQQDNSRKPKGDISSPSSNPDRSLSGVEKESLNEFSMQKHGWSFLITEKAGGNKQSSENKRATQLYTLRENLESYSSVEEGILNLVPMPNKVASPDVSVEHDENLGSRAMFELKGIQKTSPNKLTVLRRNQIEQSTTSFHGNVLVFAELDKGFKLKFSLSQNSYGSGLENIIAESLTQTAKVLDTSDKIYNIKALKELMHRQGLNSRFSWLLLCKTKLDFARDLLMADILCRVVRKILNEEIKLKGHFVHQAKSLPQLSQEHRGVECFQGNQTDIYKENLALVLNALIKNKFAKYKQVFEEVLTGLFLSKMRVLGVAHTLELQQTELNYLESKDIMDHTIEVASRNPILFLNSVQDYFAVTFEPEFTRQYRQDKFSVFSKNIAVSTNDIKSVFIRMNTIFSLREHACFILARKIFNNKKQSALFDYSDVYAEKENTSRKKSKIHQKAEYFASASKEGADTFRNFQNLPKQNSHLAHYQNVIDLSRMRKKQQFTPSDDCQVFLPSCLYKMKTSSLDLPQNSVFQSSFTVPNVDVANEWVIVLESLLKDVFSHEGSEQVLLEALIYQAIIYFFVEHDSDQTWKTLQKIRDTLYDALVCPPETIVMCQTLIGMFQDANEEIFPAESEKCYLAALICAFQVLGDPRGRGNYSSPFTLFFSWKLSILALAEGKKFHDSELAEELFDATLFSAFNHRRLFKQKHIEMSKAQQKADREALKNLPEYQQSARKNPDESLVAFEVSQEAQETQQQLFDLAKYRQRPQNFLLIGGRGAGPGSKPYSSAHKMAVHSFSQASANDEARSVVQASRVSHQPLQNYQTNPNASFQAHQSFVSIDQSRSTVNHLQKINTDVDLSDIDVQVDFDEQDEGERVQLGPKLAQTGVGKCPLTHWTLGRQTFQSQVNALKREKPLEAKAMLKDMMRDTVTKGLCQESLFEWLINFNPGMVASGVVWGSKLIKEVVFCQNQQMLSGSSISFSQNMSVHSSRSESHGAPTRKKQAHLGPYSQILGKEVGGIQRNEIPGLMYVWGSDGSGQLGLDLFQHGKQPPVRILFPRLLVPLKNEIIKEICCGYAHTLAINHFSALFVWGSNDKGQLGLSLAAPPIVRKPVRNPFVSNISKLSAGNEHCLALTKSSELYIWGAGSLCGGDETPQTEPLQLQFFKNKKIAQIACGGYHSCVLTREGEVYSWGSNEGGQLGLAQYVGDECVRNPKLVSKLVEQKQVVTQISCGETHTVVLTKENRIWGWGTSMYGQLGLGFSADSFEPGEGMLKSRVPEPTEITQNFPPQVEIKKVQAGSTVTLFQTKDAELYGCGINDLGQLGLDTYLEDMQLEALDRAKAIHGAGFNQLSSDVTIPSKVICFERMHVSSVCCGENHSLAVLGEEKNMLWSWGSYRYGQLGLGEVTMKMNPRPVQTLCGCHVHRIAAGSMHSSAVIGDSRLIESLTYNLTQDLLQNPWAIDIRGLGAKKTV